MQNIGIFLFLACIEAVFSADTGENYSLHLKCTGVLFAFSLD